MTVITPWRYHLVISLLVTGCALKQSAPAPVVEVRTILDASETGQAQRLFQLGLQQYDQGQYKKASVALQQAIDTGLTSTKQATAHKHLAFIYCVSNRESQCRTEFTKALAVDPSFELAPAEAGHPQWGPVFRSVKTGR